MGVIGASYIQFFSKLERTIVTCTIHDLLTFRIVFGTEKQSRVKFLEPHKSFHKSHRSKIYKLDLESPRRVLCAETGGNLEQEPRYHPR